MSAPCSSTFRSPAAALAWATADAMPSVTYVTVAGPVGAWSGMNPSSDIGMSSTSFAMGCSFRFVMSGRSG